MARMIRLTVAVAAEKLADLIETITESGAAVIAAAGRTSDTEADSDESTDTPIGRAVRRANAGTAATRPRVVRAARLAGRVVYTPAGTQRHITKLLDELRGVQTMRAMVLRDLAKHPASSNADVRERIAAGAKKAGLSVESVDNVIWKLVTDGVVAKRSEADA